MTASRLRTGGTLTKAELGPDALAPGPEHGGADLDRGRHAPASSELPKDEAAVSRGIAP